MSLIQLALFGNSTVCRSNGRRYTKCGINFDDDNNNRLSHLNQGLWIRNARNNFQVQLGTLIRGLEISHQNHLSKIEISTRSRVIVDLIECCEGGLPFTHHNARNRGIQLAKLESLFSRFKQVDVKFIPGGNAAIRKAEEIAWRKPTNQKNSLYWENGVPIVYIDGACSKNGQFGAFATCGIFWGPGDERNCSFVVPGRQSNNRGEYFAAIKAVEQARELGMKAIILMTDSKLFLQSVNEWMFNWKRNGWKKANGEDVKNRDLLEEFDELREEINVEIRFVSGHSGHEGNDGADKLATDLIKSLN